MLKYVDERGEELTKLLNKFKVRCRFSSFSLALSVALSLSAFPVNRQFGRVDQRTSWSSYLKCEYFL